jgi:putative peptidoglycan lipid II flippase
MLVPIFPLFNTFVAKNDMESLKHYAHKAIITLWFLAFPILIFILLFSVDGIRVLLERGAFDRNATLMVSHALIFLSFSIIPYMARDTVTRIFYAFDDAKTPLLVGLLAIIVNAVMDWLLVGPLGIGGITLSTTIVTIFNMTLLTFLLRRKVRDIKLRKLIMPSLKIVVAGSLMGILCYGLNYLWGLYFPDQTLFILAKLCVMGLIGFSFYCMMTVILKLDESKMVVDKVLSRFHKV